MQEIVESKSGSSRSSFFVSGASSFAVDYSDEDVKTQDRGVLSFGSVWKSLVVDQRVTANILSSDRTSAP